jgi:hypothetical protein
MIPRDIAKPENAEEHLRRGERQYQVSGVIVSRQRDRSLMGWALEPR